ncbi:MAG: Hsp20/alpha crystallin family protein [Thermodesulfovibrionales bacterium]|nr:Hsp20/alpha crystallin family protein [Thermodesulfovibrionales bacterium]
MAGVKKKKEEDMDIDLGVVKLGFGGLLKGIEKLVDLASHIEEAGGELKKEGGIDLSRIKEGMKGVYGFSIRTAVGGKPVVETFGNIRETPEGPVLGEEREPLTDVFDEKDEVVVISEIPGVNEEGISVDLKGDVLEISAVNKHRKYRKEIHLPASVKIETLTHSYKNGILKVRVKK